MKLLLDTCTLLWATMTPGALSEKARGLIADPQNEILVSAISAWEIATKVRLGKLSGAEQLEAEYLAVMERAGYRQVGMDTGMALRAGRLVAEHRDPFDRMLAATALSGDIAIVSPDAQLDAFGVRRVW